MEFYKKNPKIEGNITVQGEAMDDDRVVCGKDFKMFADPATFPGMLPRLVTVDFDKLTDSQKEQARAFAIAQGEKPPKHLGVIKSDDFLTTDAGEVQVVKKPVPLKRVEPKVPEKSEAKISDPRPQKVKTINDMYSPQAFVELMPGVTDGNVKKVFNQATTLADLSQASNVQLRKMGVSPSFYGRLRDKAAKLAKKEK